MKRKLLLSPLIVVILIIVAGVSLAGAAIFIGNSGDNSPSTAVDLQRGLVGQWKLDGDAKDSTPNQNDGTVTGATLATDRKGQSDKAYQFTSASSQSINVGSGSSLNITGSITISAWIKPTLTGTEQYGIVSNSNNWNTAYALYARSADAGSNVGFAVNPDGTNRLLIGQTLTSGEWAHVVGVWNGSSSVIYVNGVSFTASTNDSVVARNFGSIIIGRAPGVASPSYFNGPIDDVRIYNRALSATEITALYEEYNPGIQISDLQKGLVGNWKMDGNARDATPNSNNGTVTGATLTTDRKGQTNKAYSFAGGFDGNNINAANGSSLSFGTGAFSISLWVNALTSSEDLPAIIEKGNGDWSSGGGQTGWFLGSIAGTNTWKFSMPDGAGNKTHTSFGSLNNVGWKYLTVVVDSASASSPKTTTFIDGVQFDQTTRANVTTTVTNVLSIGRWNWPGLKRSFKGSIDDVRIYNRALSATEITALYQEYNPGIQVSDLQKGLVGQWSFDGDAKDRTPYSNSGTVTEAVLANDRKGQAQRAYGFNGTASVIDAGAPASLANLSAVSVSAWIKPTTAGGGTFGRIVDKATGTSEGGWRFYVNNTTVASGISFGVTTSSTGESRTSAASKITMGIWQHVVATWTGSLTATNIKIYVNGTEVSYFETVNGAGSRDNDSASTLKIGNDSIPDRGFDGSIDDVRIYNRVLSATEITALYQSY